MADAMTESTLHPSTLRRPRPITARQYEILHWIHSFVQTRGFAPTLREIGAQFEIRSTNAVHECLCALETKGYLTVARGTVARGLVLTAKTRVLFGEESSVPPNEADVLLRSLRQQVDATRDLLVRTATLLREIAPNAPLLVDIRNELGSR